MSYLLDILSHSLRPKYNSTFLRFSICARVGQICLNGGWYIALTWAAALNQINGWWIVVSYFGMVAVISMFCGPRASFAVLSSPSQFNWLVRLVKLFRARHLIWLIINIKLYIHICEKKILKWLREYHARMSTNNLIRMIEAKRMRMEEERKNSGNR